MRVLNILYDTYPIIIHAPGKAEFNPMWVDIIRSYETSNLVDMSCEKCDYCDIMTWSSRSVRYDDNQSHKIPMIFPSSVTRLGLNINILYVDNWNTNRIKIFKTIEYLEQSDREFVLGSDCHDSILISHNIDRSILDRYGCRMIFNAETKFWPDTMDTTRLSQKMLINGKFCYLNGGSWFGYRNTCLSFFKLAANVSQKLQEYPYSEQVCLHEPYIEMYPMVKLDYRCEMFQIVNRVSNKDLTILENAY